MFNFQPCESRSYYPQNIPFYRYFINILTMLIISFPQYSCEPCYSYDSISCTSKNILIITSGHNIYYGECDKHPFRVNSDPQQLISRDTKVLASVVDLSEIFYFFEEENVILLIKNKRIEKRIDEIFKHFTGKIEHAVAISGSESEELLADLTIQLYTKSRVFNYNSRKIHQGLPSWSEIKVRPQLYDKDYKINKTIPPVIHLLGVSGGFAKSILLSSSGPFYSKAAISSCMDPIYGFNLVECIEENEQIHEELKEGDFLVCSSKRYMFDLLSVMLWFMLGLAILAALGLVKCTIVWLIQKRRKTRRKVRFSDEINGDPKKTRYPNVSYGPEQIYSESHEFETMAQSADSINEDYKDINLSIELKEDNFEKK